MTWVEIAFIALFLGFTLLGRRRAGAPRQLPPTDGAWEGTPRPEARTLGSLLSAWEESVRAASQQAEAAPLPVEPVRLPAVTQKPALAAKPVAVAKRTPVEMAVVDRDAEHARFHERVAPAPASSAGTRPRLRRVGGLRRAVLLAEVLGPPRALREIDAP